MTHTPMVFWVAFNAAILALLFVDLTVFHRDPREITVKESMLWSAVWVALAMLFNLGIYVWRGPQAGMEFFAGYLIERALSVDNIFVFLLVFSYFRVPAKYQHRVLFWGILGALVMRALFIGAGITLLHHFHWVMYVFGGLLVVTGIKLAVEEEKEIHPERNMVLRALSRVLPITNNYVEGKFFVRQAARLVATPLLAVLVVVETTDVIFALDSIPAVLAVTRDPFIVYTSNVFAILGLRALYFALSGAMRMFHYLNYGLSVVLVFIGVKMLLADVCAIPIGLALGVVAAILAVSIAASLLKPKPLS